MQPAVEGRRVDGPVVERTRRPGPRRLERLVTLQEIVFATAESEGLTDGLRQQHEAWRGIRPGRVVAELEIEQASRDHEAVEHREYLGVLAQAAEHHALARHEAQQLGVKILDGIGIEGALDALLLR